jgi:galactose-1-phosphate uridylyltransferase
MNGFWFLHIVQNVLEQGQNETIHSMHCQNMTQLVTCVGKCSSNGMVNLDYKNDFVFENDFAALKTRRIAFEKTRTARRQRTGEANF